MWAFPITKLTKKNAFFQYHEDALKETSKHARRNERMVKEEHDAQAQSDLTGYAGQANRAATSIETGGKEPYRPGTSAYTPHGWGIRKPRHHQNINYPTR